MKVFLLFTTYRSLRSGGAACPYGRLLRQFARLVSPPFFRNPSLKNEGFFVIYYVPFATLGWCGAVARLVSPPFFSEACLFQDRLSFFIGATQFGLDLGSPSFFRIPSLRNENFFVFHHGCTDNFIESYFVR